MYLYWQSVMPDDLVSRLYCGYFGLLLVYIYFWRLCCSIRQVLYMDGYQFYCGYAAGFSATVWFVISSLYLSCSSLYYGFYGD